MERFYQQEISRINSNIVKLKSMIQARIRREKSAKEELDTVTEISKNWQTVYALETKKNINKCQIRFLEENVKILEKLNEKYEKNLKEEKQCFSLKTLNITEDTTN